MSDDQKTTPGATPADAKESSATPDKQNSPDAPDATPGGDDPKEQTGEALLKALRGEREARKALEKQLKSAQDKLGTFERRDAADAAIAKALKDRPNVKLDTEKLRGVLLRLPVEEIEAAAADLVAALHEAAKKHEPALKGQPLNKYDGEPPKYSAETLLEKKRSFGL